jgi:hypothetical protein
MTKAREMKPFVVGYDAIKVEDDRAQHLASTGWP